MAGHVNFWRDLFPEKVRQSLMGSEPGVVVIQHVPPQHRERPRRLGFSLTAQVRNRP